MHLWPRFFKVNINRLIVLAFFIILWQTLRMSASISFDDGGYVKSIDMIRQVSQSNLKPGDNVFLSSRDLVIRQDIRDLGASVYIFDSTDESGFENALLRVLDGYCKLNQERDAPSTYFIWTRDNKWTAIELSKAARNLNFFFAFQAMVPYRGAEAFVIDKFLHLQPKENFIQRYCEANKLSASKKVLLIVNTDEFSPWIGAVNTGSITWLASDPTRKMVNSVFAVKDMPPLLTYDVYWMGQLSFIPYWTFENQDMAAYELAIKQTKAQNGIVFVDRHIELGSTPLSYFKECDAGQTLLESKLFRQMCVK